MSKTSKEAGLKAHPEHIIIRAHGRPIFEWPARPLQIDTALKALAPDTGIYWYQSSSINKIESTSAASDFIQALQETIDRQAQGFFTLEEVAHILAEENQRLDAKSLLKRMKQAYEDGELTVRDVATEMPHGRGAKLHTYYDWVTPVDVDSVLEKWNVGYRLATALGNQVSTANNGNRFQPTNAVVTHHQVNGFNNASQADSAWRAKAIEDKLEQQVSPVDVIEKSTIDIENIETPSTEVVLKKIALIAKYESAWASIESDFKHANDNGLKREAKALIHGEWYEEKAVQWAIRKGKMQSSTINNAPKNSIFNQPATIHRIKG